MLNLSHAGRGLGQRRAVAAGSRGWITTFAPGSAKFVTTVVKVHGTMKASVIHESGLPVLRITVDYLFVYGQPSTVQATGKPVDPYSLATPDPNAGCQNTTGT